MKKLTLIGDVHGRYSQYKSIIKNCENSIQLGDMGVGFRYPSGVKEGQWFQNPPYDYMVKGNHRFIRGNHDNPGVCLKHSQWIPDGHIEDNIMFIGGANSIDRAYRVENYTWWADEELSSNALYAIVDKYLSVKPEIMLTHECPNVIADQLMAENGQQKMDLPSRTRQAFESMWQMHKPKYWFFGHWHVSWQGNIMGTHFQCLNELETTELEL